MTQQPLFLPLPPIIRSPSLTKGASRKRHAVLASASVPSKQEFLNLSATAHRTVSPGAMAAILDVYSTANAAVHRGGCAHELGRRAAARMEEARSDVAGAIGARHGSEISFASSSYAATLLLAQSIASTLRKGDEVIICALECDPVVRPWRTAARQRELKLSFAKSESNADEPLEFIDVAVLMSSATKLVVMQHVCPRKCSFEPVKEISEFAGSVNVPIVVDATHSLPWTLLDVNELGCDYLIADAAAVGAPAGSAFRYGRRELLERLPPVHGGESAFEEVVMYSTWMKKMTQASNWAPIPERFEVGMPSLATAAGLAVALRDHTNCMREASSDTSVELASLLYIELSRCPGVIVFGTGDEPRVPTACFAVEGVAARSVAMQLKEKDVVVDIAHLATLGSQLGQESGEYLVASFHPSAHNSATIHDFVSLLTDILQTIAV